MKDRLATQILIVGGIVEMDSGMKHDLLERLAQSFQALKATLEGVDLELRVYPDSDWRIRDILGHLATWDREVTKSLLAFLDGSEYLTPGLDVVESSFNQRAVEEQRKLATPQVVEEWGAAREDFKTAIGKIPMDLFTSEFLYPWGGERGPITVLAGYMIEHDEEHKAEIVKALEEHQGQ
jgi:hypothetical protein